MTTSKVSLFHAAACFSVVFSSCWASPGGIPAGPWDGDGGIPGPFGRPDSGFLIGQSGGEVDLLRFGVFGDPRPAAINDDGRYPEPLVSELVSQMASLGVQFIVGVGDWTFAGGRDAERHLNAQYDSLLRAESLFGGRFFHALGNHDCGNATASNCPDEDETPNIRLFRRRLEPGREHTWYSIRVGTSLGEARFIFTSPNAWTDRIQGAWLEKEVFTPAGYTFLIQHTPPSGTGPEAPGTLPALSIVDRGPPVTLKLFGHSHMFRRLGVNAFILGNGGGPLDTSGCATGCFYGFGVVSQNPDGTVTLSVYERGVELPRFVYAFNPDGSPAE
jgi:hypothetical protein